MISVYLCDDEPIWLKHLYKAVSDYRIKSDWEIKIEYQSTSPEDLLQYLTEHAPSGGIFFLDIDFKASINGIILARQIRDMDPQASIIFVTAHDEMVMETFRLKLEALDFIIKDGRPLTEQIHHCLAHIEGKYLRERAKSPSSITIRTAGSYHTLLSYDIYYIESIKNTHKVCLHLQSGIYCFTGSLSSLREHLGSDFLQCHKACVVNTRHIRELDLTERRVLLDNGECCTCSIREWRKLIQRCRNTSDHLFPR